jgi:predicted RNA binding protein YcfA (HicA-like mRNA interferase family)
MPRVPRIRPKKAIKALKKAGFFIDHQTGSHVILYKDNNSSPVTVPYHNKDLKVGTMSSIIKQAGLTVQEFIDLL